MASASSAASTADTAAMLQNRVLIVSVFMSPASLHVRKPPPSLIWPGRHTPLGHWPGLCLFAPWLRGRWRLRQRGWRGKQALGLTVAAPVDLGVAPILCDTLGLDTPCF